MQTSGSQEEVERRQADTLAADMLENRYAAHLDFGGIQTDQVYLSVSSCSRPSFLMCDCHIMILLLSDLHRPALLDDNNDCPLSISTP